MHIAVVLVAGIGLPKLDVCLAFLFAGLIRDFDLKRRLVEPVLRIRVSRPGRCAQAGQCRQEKLNLTVVLSIFMAFQYPFALCVSDQVKRLFARFFHVTLINSSRFRSRISRLRKLNFVFGRSPNIWSAIEKMYGSSSRRA